MFVAYSYMSVAYDCMKWNTWH